MTSTLKPLSDALPPPTSFITPAAIPLQLSFPLPHARLTNVHLHLTIHETSILLFLTTKTAESSGGKAVMGSFVYALPDRRTGNKAPLSTSLYVREQNIETTNRIARILARRLNMPVYVANSMSFVTAGGGGMVEEEMEAVMRVVDIVVEQVERSRGMEPKEAEEEGVEVEDIEVEEPEVHEAEEEEEAEDANED
ncbi:hypothetical protein RUND412_002218 [Rhizina undulata]